jgi:hypothetical protein
MCRAIGAAYEVDEVKDIRDKAIALETYARQAKNVEAERQACEIRLRAERKVGQLLKQLAERAASAIRATATGNREKLSRSLRPSFPAGALATPPLLQQYQRGSNGPQA